MARFTRLAATRTFALATLTLIICCVVPAGTDSARAATPAPTVSITLNPSSIISGGSSTLAWSSTNATSCTASGNWAWNGPVATSGTRMTSQSGTNLYIDPYTLTCAGAGGPASSTAYLTIEPTGGATATLTASPATINSGGSSTLTWSSTNATSCTASGGWSGTTATSGTHVVSPTATTTYTLSCSGAGGTSGPASATVTVNSSAPAVTLTANPTTIASGGKSTLTWSSSNATSCAASGGWTGTEATSGTLAVSPTATTVYTLLCGGAGGTTQASATVTVSSSAPTVTLTANPTSIAQGGSSKLTWSSTGSGGAYLRQTAQYSAYPGAVSASWTVKLDNVLAGSTIYVVGIWPNYVNTYPTMAVTDGTNAYTLLDRYDDKTLFNLGIQGTQSMGHWYAANVPAGNYTIDMSPAPETWEDWVGVVAFEVAGISANPLEGHALNFQAGMPPGSNTVDATVANAGSNGILIATTFDDIDYTAPTVPLVGSGSINALSSGSLWDFTGSGKPAATAEYALVASAGAHTTTFSPQEGGPQYPDYMTSAVIFAAPTNGASCSASGGWSGTEPGSGTLTVSPTSTITYTLECADSGGTGEASATVAVTGSAPPTVSISANPTTIASGSDSTLTWSSANAKSCTASGGWTGAKATSGTLAVAPTTTTTYTLACTGAGGSTQASANVAVSASSGAPTATITLTPSSIVSGADSTVAWSSTNATACTASGNWSFNGEIPTSGTEVTSQNGNSYYVVTYTATCTGPGGSASASANLTVSP